METETSSTSSAPFINRLRSYWQLHVAFFHPAKIKEPEWRYDYLDAVAHRESDGKKRIGALTSYVKRSRDSLNAAKAQKILSRPRKTQRDPLLHLPDPVLFLGAFGQLFPHLVSTLFLVCYDVTTPRVGKQCRRRSSNKRRYIYRQPFYHPKDLLIAARQVLSEQEMRQLAQQMEVYRYELQYLGEEKIQDDTRMAGVKVMKKVTPPWDDHDHDCDFWEYLFVCRDFVHLICREPLGDKRAALLCLTFAFPRFRMA
jgi:hypothetical protein